MADERNRDLATDERFGRRVHEGMNGGVSRNAHTSGEVREGELDADAGRRDAPLDTPDRGRGGYGDDTGFTGGTRAGGTTENDLDEPATDTGGPTDPRRAGATGRPGPSGHHAHSAWAGTPSISHEDGVGHEAPSGMEELEHDRWERGER